MKKTVFILGAGASHEIKMPLGPELAARIATCLDFGFNELGKATGNLVMLNVARHSSDPNAHGQAAKIIRDGVMLAASIDDFMDTFDKNDAVRNMGKAAIAACILEAERNSHFYVDPRNLSRIDFANFHHNWFVQLMRLAGPRTQNPERLFEDIAFIVFNYDRCLEHFIFHALRSRYDLTEDVAKGILKAVTILHPYGTVGDLPQCAVSNPVDYGVDERRVDLNKISAKIRTYTEEIGDDEPKTGIHNLLKAAGNIVFLGFGFHQQNMKLLQPSIAIDADVYATAFKASDLRVSNIESQIREFVGDGKPGVRGKINVATMDSVTLMSEYGPTIFRD